MVEDNRLDGSGVTSGESTEQDAHEAQSEHRVGEGDRRVREDCLLGGQRALRVGVKGRRQTLPATPPTPLEGVAYEKIEEERAALARDFDDYKHRNDVRTLLSWVNALKNDIGKLKLGIDALVVCVERQQRGHQQRESTAG